MWGASRRAATASARSKRRRCSSKSSSIPDLADRRGDRRDAQAGARQHAVQAPELRVVEVEHADLPGAAQLDPADAELLEQLALRDRVRRDLVGEARERPHPASSLGGRPAML